MEEEGFTLLELLIVIIILATLAVVGAHQYQVAMERARTGEAKQVLAQMRKAQKAYYLEWGVYASGVYNDGTLPAGLNLDIPPGKYETGQPCNNASYYFEYWYNYGGGRAVSGRCGSGGKYPNKTTPYLLFLDYNGSNDGRLWTSAGGPGEPYL